MPSSVLGWEAESDKTWSSPKVPQSVEEFGNREPLENKRPQREPNGRTEYFGAHTSWGFSAIAGSVQEPRD